MNVIVIIVPLIIFLYYSQQSACEMCLDEKYPNVRPSIKKKLCLVLNNESIVNRLQKERAWDSIYPVYPNKLVNLIDGSVIGLHHANSDEKFAHLLDDIEEKLDEILSESQ